jgi:hypothetical protein
MIRDKSMGLLANPVTLNDGTGDRIFSFRSQRPDNRSVIGDYIEDAAASAANSLITVKHDLRAVTAPRALIQRVYKAVPAASSTGEYLQITQNYTLVASSLFTTSELTGEFTLFLDALSETGILAGLRAKKI